MSAIPTPQNEPDFAWIDGALDDKGRSKALEGGGEAAWPVGNLPAGVLGGHVARPSWLESAARISYRFIEILVALFGIILTFPLAAIIAWIIRRDSPGPSVFRQTRLTQDGKPFIFYKFRTLYADARERFPELYCYSYTPEQMETRPFKTEDDPRVTRVGKWLRRTTLDEIPNLYNLLRGEVTMVGPRPEIPEMLASYRPDQLLKFSVKPGLTGLAQVSGRNRLTMQETIACDLAYVRNRSWRLDLWILMRTFKRVIDRHGAL